MLILKKDRRNCFIYEVFRSELQIPNSLTRLSSARGTKNAKIWRERTRQHETTTNCNSSKDISFIETDRTR